MHNKLAIAAIELYQKYLSPFKGTTCRFYPSCSQYSKESIIRYGLVKGAGLTLLRLAKCHPYHPGGYDPVK